MSKMKQLDIAVGNQVRNIMETIRNLKLERKEMPLGGDQLFTQAVADRVRDELKDYGHEDCDMLVSILQRAMGKD